MNTLEALGDHRAHAQELGALGRPVAGGAGAVFLAGEDHQRAALGLVAHGRVIDRHHFAGGEVLGHAALDLRGQLVADPDVGEGAAHHDLMVPAAGAVGVEVGLRHLAFTQVFASRRGQLDGAGRADVVGGDRVAEHAEDTGLDDVGDRLGLHAHALEIGRVLNIGGADVPGVGLAAGHLDALPGLVALEHVGVAGGEHLVRHVLALEGGDLFVGRPDVLQIDGLAVLAFAERLGGQIDLHRAGQGVGDHQGRRGQIVGPHVGVHPAFEVAVARQHRAGHQVALLDGLGNGFRQRPGIADAGGAAIAHQVEAERVQRLGQARALQIVGDHLRAGRQRGLHPRLDLQALFDGLLGHQAGGD